MVGHSGEWAVSEAGPQCELLQTGASFRFEPRHYPAAPGCYLMRNGRGVVIYVGKAINLRSRLSSYFYGRSEEERRRNLVAAVQAVEVMLVHTETEALILENNLIKRYQPAYNRALTHEDTGYAYLALTQEALPRLVTFHKHGAHSALDPDQIRRRFGPYVSGRLRDLLLDFVTNHFQLRTCDTLPRKVCLRYHMHYCGGICESLVSPAQYQQGVQEAVAFLSGSGGEILSRLTREMKELAEACEFERALRIKNLIALLQQSLEKQVVETDTPHDQDVLWFGPGHVLIAHLQTGILHAMELRALPAVLEEEASRREFLLARYRPSGRGPCIPAELIVNDLADPRRVERELSRAAGRKIPVAIPQRGVKRRLLELCQMNYEYRLGRRAEP